MLKAVFQRLNYAPIFQGRLTVWGGIISYPSLDRWLYLFLHRHGWMGALEKSVIDRLVTPGMTILDVGGNIGLYAYYFAQKTGKQGRVIVVEPVAQLAQAIEQMAKQNNLSQLQLLRCAAGDEEATLQIEFDVFNSGNNVMVEAKDLAKAEVVVAQKRLDQIDFTQPPDFIKIDVQGWEEKALKGLSGILSAEKKPIIFCEISESSLRQAGSSTKNIVELLQQSGYQFYLPHVEKTELKILPISAKEIESKAQRCLYFDIIAQG